MAIFLSFGLKNSCRMECRLHLCPFTRSLWLGYKALKCLYTSRKASHLQELRFLFDVLHLFSLQKSLSLNVNSHCCLWLINSPWARGGGQAHLGRRCLTVIFLKAYVSDEQVHLKPAVPAVISAEQVGLGSLNIVWGWIKGIKVSFLCSLYL